MTATWNQAEGDMKSLVWLTINNGAAALVGYVPEVRWPGVEKPVLPANDKYWFRVSFQTVGPGGKEGVGSTDSGDGSGMYETSGLIFIQCFGPMSGASQVWANLKLLADLALNSVRGKHTTNGVWMRNERINPLQPDGKFQRINVVAEFTFTELR